MIQFLVILVVTTVSFLIICALDQPFDIVMNSLAFTFIAEVGGFFNDPLSKQMASTEVKGLDPAIYTCSVKYLYPTYQKSNTINEDGTYTDGGWYICEDEEKAGLLSDYKVRHNDDAYPHPSRRIVWYLDLLMFGVPVVAVLLGGISSGAIPLAA
ncbi:unnamed protein product, partial [Polarella glacialis]